MQESLLYEHYRTFKKNRAAVLGFFIALFLIICAIFAPLIAPLSPIEQDLPARLLPPIWNEAGRWPFLLGTDDFGRDLFSRLVYGSRISLMIGVISVGISLAVGLLMGAFAGFFAGRGRFGNLIDAVIMRPVDILLSIPAILLAIVIVSILGPSLFNAMIAIGIVGIPAYARIVRASILQEKQKEYIIASRISGSSTLRLIFLVTLPNCMGPIIVQATMGFASAVLEAAGLSFLSLGAQPPTPEWGAMLADALQFIVRAPWIITFPGLAIFLTVLGFNLIGDGLMDVLDPKLKDR